MKKIFLAICFLFLMAQSFVFADEIVDSKGNVTPCKIVTVSDGFVEYNKDGNLYSFVRSKDLLIFNDYVDVRIELLKKNPIITRYSGKVIVKDLESVRLRNENGDMDIPFYRVKSVGIYKP